MCRSLYLLLLHRVINTRNPNPMKLERTDRVNELLESIGAILVKTMYTKRKLEGS
eukprot:GAHX01004138.1.p1 GENE.GAHX01004138.1~~GAHX01004138.1.p1  ORF type:complete len:55 (+),score=5.60 GAHX01004138.1:145-309(+)